MEINKLFKMISATTLAGIMFVGCGGGGSSASSGPTVLTGTFVDAPVQGLHYKTTTQEGYTDATGGFKYIAGERVEFKLGNLILGEVSADALITPYTLAGDINISNPSPKAINIALLLQNFDAVHGDGILDVTKLKDMDFGGLDLEDTLKVTNVISTRLPDTNLVTNFSLIDVDTAKATMKDYVALNSIKYDKKFTQTYLDQVIFYEIDNVDGDDNPVEPFILKRKFRDGIFYGDDSGTPSGGSGFENWGTYTIENGVLKAIDPTTGTAHDIKITAVGDGYIEGTLDGNSGIWYTDKSKAEAALSGSTTSFVSAKTIVMNDEEGDTTMKFNADGVYVESGYDLKAKADYSCTGKWKDFGNNKIGITCGEENGSITTTDPDGTVDNLESIIQFASSSLTKGATAIVTGTEGDTDVTVKSVSDILPITAATGFTAEYLNGKTLWTVDASGSVKVMTTFTFINNTLTYGSPWSGSVSYTIMSDGIIDTIETNDNTGHEYYKIVDVEGTKISLCEGENLSNVKSCTIAKQWLFTNQADAQAFFDSLSK